MRIFTILFVAGTIATMFLSSCSEDTPVTPGVTAKNFLPLSVGNYWIYSRSTLDTNNKPTTTVTDSAVVTKALTFNGKSAHQVIYYTIGAPNQNDTTYFSKSSDSSLYMWFNIDAAALTDAIPGVVVPNFWTKVYSTDKQPWASFDTTLKNISYSGFNLDIKLTVSGKVTNDTTVSLSGTSYSAAQSQLNFNVIAYMAGTTTPIMTLNIPQNYVLIDKIGPFSMTTPSSKIVLGGTSVLSSLEGSMSVLKSYKLK